MNASTKPVVVIINAGAGHGHDGSAADKLRGLLRDAGLDAELVLADGGDKMIDAAKRALDGGARLVAAGGGDGTINAVASIMVDSGVNFGVLPMGTLNHFAKDVGIPLELEAAVRNLVDGVPRAVDAGEVNGRIFLNNSGLGLYPDLVHDREKQQSRLGRGKWLAATWAGVAALRRFPFLSMRFNVDGERLARRTPFVFIGNNAYIMQGLAIGERKRLDAGILSLYVAQHPTRLGLLRFAFKALTGGLAEERDFDALEATAFDIETRHKQLRVSTDGEVTMMQTPLRFRIRPGALQVLAPRDPHDSTRKEI